MVVCAVMRTSLLVKAFGGVLIPAWGCGGKVVVDGEPGGAGGDGTSSSSGTTSSSATSSSSSSSGTGFTCDLLCGGPIGICACSGQCSDGKMRAVGCGGASAGGFTCGCSVDGQLVGQCDEPTMNCGLQGCCWAIFGG